MPNIAILPARSGSKRIPHKNIALIDSIPALGITITKLIDSGLINEIYVSTDSEDISSIAIKYGAKVPELRSLSLSDDSTPSETVIRDFISNYITKPIDLNIFCVYPLSVLINHKYISDALQLLTENPNSFVISAGKFEINPLRHTFTIEKGYARILHPQNNNLRSQDLPDCFFDAGMFYLATAHTWLEPNKYWYVNNAQVVMLEKEDAIDVDCPEDLEKLRTRFNSLR